MPGETPDETLDAIGLACPQPVFRARVCLDAMRDGQVLAVLADDPMAELDLRVFCERTGHAFIDCRAGRPDDRRDDRHDDRHDDRDDNGDGDRQARTEFQVIRIRKRPAG